MFDGILDGLSTVLTMSYDIDFIRSNQLSAENVDKYLEPEASDTDPHFISKELMNEIKVELAKRGFNFESFEGREEDYLELNFETYQICMFNSQIAISLPYWDVNSSNAITDEVGIVSDVLIGKGFTGYDPQTGELFRGKGESISTDFDRLNKQVNEHFSAGITTGKRSEGWRLIKLGVFFVIAVILIRVIASLVSKFF